MPFVRITGLRKQGCIGELASAAGAIRDGLPERSIHLSRRGSIL